MSLRRQPPLVGEDAAPPAWMERVLKRRILVHLDTDQTIQGVLMELAEDGYILRAAKLLGYDEGPDGVRRDVETLLAGEQWIPHGRVVFAQLDD